MNNSSTENGFPMQLPPDNETETDNLKGIYVFLDGVGDTTVRPNPSPIFRQIRPGQPPPVDPPSEQS